jgi:hypothetical protein
MAKVNIQRTARTGMGAMGGFIAATLVQKAVQPDPNKWTDELALGAIPLLIVFVTPPKYNTMGAAAAGASLYPLFESLARELKLTE